MEGTGFILYALVKFGAYVGWSGYGAKIHGHSTRLLLKALLFGSIRLALGISLGLGAIFILANVVIGLAHSSIATYLIVYLPVRWVEWSLMAIIMDRKHRTVMAFLGGATWRSILWKVGGIVISCLADIPVILAVGGLPIGRFMC